MCGEGTRLCLIYHRESVVRRETLSDLDRSEIDLSQKQSECHSRNGQESFVCVRAISPNRELTRQRKLSHPEETILSGIQP